MKWDVSIIGCVAAFFLVLIAAFLFYIKRFFSSPFIGFSVGSALERGLDMSLLAPCLRLFSLLFLLGALVDPHRSLNEEEQNASEGIALYLLLDRSGSMGQTTTLSNQSKIEALKDITIRFLKERPPGDLIGLMTFARGAKILLPLTKNRQALEMKVASISAETDPAQEGTAMGYALLKAANLFKLTRKWEETASFAIKGAALIIVTDGFPYPNPEDRTHPLRGISLMEAAEKAKQLGLHVYIVSLDPLLGNERFGPERRLMQNAAKRTGGDLYILDRIDDLSEVYTSINTLEKSTFIAHERKGDIRIDSYIFPLVAVAASLFAASCFIETCWIRTVP